MPTITGKAGFVAGVAAIGIMWAAPAQAQEREFDVPAQEANKAIPQFAQQAGVQIVASGDRLRGKRTKAVSGKMDVRAALRLLLDGTGLTANYGDNNTVAIVPLGDSQAEDQGATPEVLVTGQRSRNVDIRRTEDDPQPYVVFTAEDISRSQANTAEEFLRTRLPMNTVQGAPSQNQNIISNRSKIDLRGLGDDQTLILVDGRRRAAPLNRTAGDSDFSQPDLNGIPVAAIARIEILPSGAGGIYGGGAMGGVINVILKHDYRGLEAGFTYGDTTDFKAPTRRFDVSGGLSLGASTRMTFSASHSNGGDLRLGARDYGIRGRALQFANNRTAFDTLFSPPAGYMPNIRSTSTKLQNGVAVPTIITSVPVGYTGYAGPGGNSLNGPIANVGQYNLALPNDANGRQRNLMSAAQVTALNAGLEHRFSDQLRMFVDLTYSKNIASSDIAALSNSATINATAPNNPFGQAIRVSFPSPGVSALSKSVSEVGGVSGGLIWKLNDKWTVSADHAWNRSTGRSQSATPSLTPAGTAAIARGELNILRDLNLYPIDFTPYLLPYPSQVNEPARVTLNDSNLRIAGSLLDLPGGALTFTALLEHRQQTASKTSDYYISGARTFNSIRPRRSQTVDSAYAELRAPLIGAKNSIPFINELEIQASVRHDRYTTDTAAQPVLTPGDPILPGVRQKFQATKFTVGASWKPVSFAQLRASYATAFLPPSISQIAPLTELAKDFIADPLRGDTKYLTDFTLTQGGNPNLLPEKSTSFSAGVVVAPPFLSGLRLSADYTRIIKRDEIVALDFQTFVDLETAFPGRVVRGPRDATDPVGYAGIVTAIDASLVNVSQSKVEAVDLQADYKIATKSAGEFHGYAIATWQPTSSTRFLSSDPFFNASGFSDGTLKWRGNGGLTWALDGLTLGWNAQYYNSYKVFSSTTAASGQATAIKNQSSARIPSQTYHDFLISYRFGPGDTGNSVVNDGLLISLGIQNAFNKSRPIIAITGAAGGYSPYGDPRRRRFTLSLRKSF